MPAPGDLRGEERTARGWGPRWQVASATRAVPRAREVALEVSSKGLAHGVSHGLKTGS